jgi:integrase
MGVYPRPLANGRHVYRVGVRFNGETYFETVGTDRRVAERLDKQRKREVNAGTYVPKGKSSGTTTILDYAAEWFEARGNRSKRDDAQRMRDHILPRIGAVKLQDLTRLQVRDLIRALIADDQTISIKTAKNAFGVFRTMMQEALDSDLISRDPCGRLPRGTWPSDAAAGTKGKQKREIYTQDEVVQLTTNELVPAGVRVLNTIFFYTAAREGEGCGPTWRQWSRDSLPLGALAIDWAYDHKPLKQDEQPRRVPVHPVLAETLDWWWREGFALTYGRAPTLDDFIVPRLAAGRWSKVRTLGSGSDCHTRSSCYKAFSRACVKLGIECRSLHSTRHTAITAARRGDRTGALKAPLERVTHNAKGQIIDCYTHWEWEPLCRAILAIAYVAAVPVREPAPLAPSLSGAPGTTPGAGEFAAIFAASATGLEIIDKVGGGAGNRTRGTHHESPRRTAIVRAAPPSKHPPDSRQIARVDARFAAGQSTVEDAARNYLVAGSDGEPCAHLALQLAAAVMSSPVVRLALAVLGGGPHVLTRATELASLVIPPPAPERKVASLADARKRRDEKS